MLGSARISTRPSRAALLLLLLAGAGMATPRPARATEVPPDPASAPASPRTACDPVPLGGGSGNALPATARALHGDRHLTILAVGSALAGSRSGADETLPERTARLLERMLPGISVAVRLRNQRGASAAEMAGTIAGELTARPATLVLWQTGTVEAAKHTPPDTFRQALAAGLGSARNAASDLVLIDPLYSRMLEKRTDVAPYETALAHAAEDPGTALFPRYALVQHWVQTGAVDLERAARPDRSRTMSELHECLAAALAQLIVTRSSAEAVLAAPP